ncbi:MAG: hypothetical protein RR033_02985 [Clostridia bacterium]
MAFQKKIIILNDIGDKGSAGIIKITENGGVTTANVSIHNCGKFPMTLLMSADKNLMAFEVENKSILSLGNVELGKTVDCIVLEDNKAVLYGSSGGEKYRCFNLPDEYARQKELAKNKQIKAEEKVKKLTQKDENNSIKLLNNSDDVDVDILGSENEVETSINLANNDKKTTINKVSMSKNSNVVLNEGIRYNGDNFYLAVKPQLDEMFICYPQDNRLMEIVPNSKWVRVSVTDDHYVVGLIYELDEPLYICYGIHGVFTQSPPQEISGLCEWLPLSLEDTSGEGYWLLYQSARDGTTIKPE